MANFKERLKELREKKQISREELAKAVELSYWAIAKYETGERTPDLDTLQRLADFFKVSIDYLIGRKSPKSGYDEPHSDDIPPYTFAAHYEPTGGDENLEEVEAEMRKIIEDAIRQARKVEAKRKKRHNP